MRKRISAAPSGIVDTVPGRAIAPLLRGEEPGDEDLIFALAAGNLLAMDLLYQRYSGLLYSLAYRIVADLRVAEDLVQEVFVAVWQSAPSYTPEVASVCPWMTSIMRHRAIDHLRKMRRQCTWKEVPWEVGEQDNSIDSSDTWHEAWRSLQGALVRECLMRLPPGQREVIELSYFEGKTQKEIASLCQIPLGTVKARMRLGMQHLKRELEKRGVVDL